MNCFLEDECSVYRAGLGPETPLHWVDFRYLGGEGVSRTHYLLPAVSVISLKLDGLVTSILRPLGIGTIRPCSKEVGT